MDKKAVIWTKEAGVCTITMNSPETMNAFDFEVAEGLIAAFEACHDDETRVVILTSAGKAFSVGGRLTTARDYYPQDLAVFFRDLAKPLNRLITEMRLLPKPIIAAVNGAAAGAGMSLATACDLRIASEKAVFKAAYTSLGVNPDGAWTLTVPALVGLGKANEMLYLDNPISAVEALQCGLVNKVVPADKLLEETGEWAKRIAQGATKAFAQSKELINNTVMPYLEVQLEKERQGLMKCARTEDYKEGLMKFLENKKPEFKGR